MDWTDFIVEIFGGIILMLMVVVLVLCIEALISAYRYWQSSTGRDERSIAK